jgi:hypothetical protein
VSVYAQHASPATAQDLVADLSQRRIDISTGFSGAEVLVFDLKA